MKDTRKIHELRLWDKNPRTINKEEYESLKRKIQRWGQFKPLLITEDGEVIGGNMRLRAYRELGIEDIWVSIVNPQSEAEKVEIAIADNELSGRWDDVKLAELLEKHKTEIVLEDYKVDLGRAIGLNELLGKFGGDDINFDDIVGTEDREKQFKDLTVTCPHCEKSFEIKV